MNNKTEKNNLHQDQHYLKTALQAISGKWRVLILITLKEKPVRFKDISSSLPTLTDKVLIQELKSLAELGILSRISYGEMPPRVEYKLTEKGQLILPLIDQLRLTGKQLLTQTLPNDSKPVL